MGAADIVPGVSGGTVALLLGIYARLLAALSHVDRELFGMVRKGAWGKAARHLDLRLLVPLGLGIATGFLALADVIHFLLEQHPRATMAAFFGLILASSFLVLRMARPTSEVQTIRYLVLCSAAIWAAKTLVTGDILQPQPGLPYVFLCGVVAICAMILPGLSGAYLLILLGKYHDFLGVAHRLKGGDFAAADIATAVVFGAGCVVGLLLFSKVLKALLSRFHNAMMIILGGFMIGSLWKIWPFQINEDGVEVIDGNEVTQPYWPDKWTSESLQCLAIAAGAVALVFIADTLAKKLKKPVQ